MFTEYFWVLLEKSPVNFIFVAALEDVSNKVSFHKNNNG